MSRYTQNGYPWSNGVGTDVTDCVTAREVMEKANLDWRVKKCEVMAKMPFTFNEYDDSLNDIDKINGSFVYEGKVYRNLQGAYATYRADKNIPLGFVKEKYNVVQNTDAFTFFDEAIGFDKCKWEYAGAFGLGHKIFVTARIQLDTDITINGNKDYIENYLVFSNSHDGSSSITIMFTPIRVFCTNCLNAGLDKAESYIRIRHTDSVKNKLTQGAEILHVACQRANHAKELYQYLGKIKLTDDEVLHYIIDNNLNDKEKSNLITFDPQYGYKRVLQKDYRILEDTGISMRKANVIENMYSYYMDGIGQQHIAGTAWGAYNAVTGFYSNVANLEGAKRMDSLLYGNAQNVMQKALVNVYNLKAA